MTNPSLMPTNGGAMPCHNPAARGGARCMLTTLRRTIVIGLLIMGTAALASAAYANDDGAKMAITRAEAKIDLISRETPAATQNPSFARAHDRLDQARDALRRGRDQQAQWLANEAELASDATASAAQLNQLELSRAELGRAVSVLESELGTK